MAKTTAMLCNEDPATTSASSSTKISACGGPSKRHSNVSPLYMLTGMAITCASLITASSVSPSPLHQIAFGSTTTDDSGESTLPCSDERRAVCFKREMDKIVVMSESIVPIIDDQIHDQFCSQYQKVKNCWKNDAAGRCSTTNPNFTTYDFAADYICGPGRLGYRRSRECLNTTDFRQSVCDCHVNYDNQLIALQRDRVDEIHHVRAKMLCRIIDILLSCLKNGAEKTCGRDAGEWIFNYKDKFLSPIKQLIPECQSLDFPVALYILIGVLLMALVSLALALICHCTKFGQQMPYRTRRQTVTNKKVGSGNYGRHQTKMRRLVCCLQSSAEDGQASLAKKLTNEINREETALRGGVEIDRQQIVTLHDDALEGEVVVWDTSCAKPPNCLDLPATWNTSSSTERTPSEMAGAAFSLSSYVERKESPLLHNVLPIGGDVE